jgi:hypothetical protein
LLVHYSSEARGYSLLILLALSSFECLNRHLERASPAWGALFATTAALGVLSHPSFIYFYVAACAWWVSALMSRKAKWQAVASSAAVCHAAPVCLTAVFYLLNLRHMTWGGGPDYSLPWLLAEAGSLAVGGPQGGPLAVAASFAFVVGVVAALYVLYRARAPEWKFFALAILVPTVPVVVARPPFLFVRYFLIPIAFGIVLWSFLLAALYRSGRRGRWAACALVVLFIVGNSWHVAQLARVGRGQYLAALSYMARNDASDVVTVTSDHPHGNRILIDFYSSYVRPERNIMHLDECDWSHAPPEWVILHRDRAWIEPAQQEVFPVQGSVYVLQRVFDCAKLSGWQWLCYRRQHGVAVTQ